MWKFLLNLLILPYLVTAILDHRKLAGVREKLTESRKNGVAQAEQVVTLTRGKAALRAERDDIRTRLANAAGNVDLRSSMKNPLNCPCRGCKAMRASDTVYASRMLRSIDRDIAEEKDG